MEQREASLTVAGLPRKNEAERKAFLLLALLDDGDYRNVEDAAQEASEALRDTERQVQVLRERWRLLRAALALDAAALAPSPGGGGSHRSSTVTEPSSPPTPAILE